MQRLPNIGSTPGKFDRHSTKYHAHAPQCDLTDPLLFPDSVPQLAGRGSYSSLSHLTRTAVRLQSDAESPVRWHRHLARRCRIGARQCGSHQTLHAYVVCAALTDCRVKRDKREHDSSDSRPIKDTLQHLPRTLPSRPHVHLAHVAGLSRCHLGISFWNVTWGVPKCDGVTG